MSAPMLIRGARPISSRTALGSEAASEGAVRGVAQ